MPKPPSQASNTQVTPAPALEKRMRPTYKTEYKMKIIAQTDAYSLIVLFTHKISACNLFLLIN
jgi:hypothetical protein